MYRHTQTHTGALHAHAGPRGSPGPLPDAHALGGVLPHPWVTTGPKEAGEEARTPTSVRLTGWANMRAGSFSCSWSSTERSSTVSGVSRSSKAICSTFTWGPAHQGSAPEGTLPLRSHLPPRGCSTVQGQMEVHIKGKRSRPLLLTSPGTRWTPQRPHPSQSPSQQRSASAPKATSTPRQRGLLRGSRGKDCRAQRKLSLPRTPRPFPGTPRPRSLTCSRLSFSRLRRSSMRRRARSRSCRSRCQYLSFSLAA